MLTKTKTIANAGLSLSLPLVVAIAAIASVVAAIAEAVAAIAEASLSRGSSEGDSENNLMKKGYFHPQFFPKGLNLKEWFLKA